jgi:glycosyltransferase involved in cell wall biosynthesis
MENLQFYIAGDGDEMQQIKNSIKELHLESKVILLGKKSPDELKEITREAYIGINLLENRGLSYYYSLGNKTFDYIQAGLPQIMIGFPEYIELNNQYHVGLVVKELTVENIYSVLTKLLTDKNLYLELQKNCFNAANVLCWENEEQNLLSIYEQI